MQQKDIKTRGLAAPVPSEKLMYLFPSDLNFCQPDMTGALTIELNFWGATWRKTISFDLDTGGNPACGWEASENNIDASYELFSIHHKADGQEDMDLDFAGYDQPPNVCGLKVATALTSLNLTDVCNGAADSQCTCANGVAATGFDCTADGTEVCTSCNPGFTGPQCVDINECTNGMHECDTDALCVNKPGSYSCSEPECTCANGTPATGEACTSDGATMCASCNPGYSGSTCESEEGDCPTIGDLNDDGSIDVLDVVTLVQAILGINCGTSCCGDYNCNGPEGDYYGATCGDADNVTCSGNPTDFNNDGSCNVLDVVQMVQYILSN